MSDASGTSTYTYDDADRLTSYENGAGATVSTPTTRRATSLPSRTELELGHLPLQHARGDDLETDWNSNETQFGYDRTATSPR